MINLKYVMKIAQLAQTQQNVKLAIILKDIISLKMIIVVYVIQNKHFL